MIKLTYVEVDGTAHGVEADIGDNLMEVAVRNGIAAIEGECGGAGACATCHVYIPDEWQVVTGKVSEDEQMMLEFGSDVDDRSRLGCQIKLTEAMDGMTVLTPASQR